MKSNRTLFKFLKYLVIGNLIFCFLISSLRLIVGPQKAMLLSAYPQNLIWGSLIGILVFLFSLVDRKTVTLALPSEAAVPALRKALSENKYVVLEEKGNVLNLRSLSLYKRINYFGEDFLRIEIHQQSIAVNGLLTDIRAIRKMLLKIGTEINT